MADGVPNAHAFGLLTKTVARSPVVKWVLHARIRNRDCNDVIFIGEDSVQVKQVMLDGHLEHIISMRDFGERIRAASILSLDADLNDDDAFAYANGVPSQTTADAVPPQLLVLTLTSDDLVFLYLKGPIGALRFVHSTLPMPRSEKLLYQAGSHLATDSLSRAMAVAANEREVVLYSLKGRDRISDEIRNGQPNWTPIAATRQLRIEGVIQHMDFLIPPEDDEDHVVLLLIVVDQRRTKAIWVEWYCSSHLHSADVHPGQPIDAAQTVSSLLIPLKNSAFLHITGNDLKLYKDILSGSLTRFALGNLVMNPVQPGISPRLPVWASWCRPVRNKAATRDSDFVYIARDDGVVVLTGITSRGEIESSTAAIFDCHVGSAFASLGGPRDPDILVVAGDMSRGTVVSIGHFSTPGRIANADREETMQPTLIQTLPNWASVTDMIITTLPQSHGRSPRSRDGVFVTSGRELYGTITELRNGLEGRLVTYVPLEGLRSVVDVWALPEPTDGSLILLLSLPHLTRIIRLSADAEEIDEIEDSKGYAFEMKQRTLAAEVTASRNLIQVTEHSICATTSMSAGFEDKVSKDFGDDDSIVAAAIEPDSALIVCIERVKNNFFLTCTRHIPHQSKESGPDQEHELRALTDPLTLRVEPLSLALAKINQRILAVVASTDGMLRLVRVDVEGGKLELVDSLRLVDPDQSLCDNLAILASKVNSTTRDSRLLAVCGLRDGSLLATQISIATGLSFGPTSNFGFGQSTVKLVRHSSEPCAAYAMSGLDTCLLTWDGRSAESLSVQSIWVSDKERPELAQGSIMACTRMPGVNHLAAEQKHLADALLLISGDEFLITSLDPVPTTVPRQIRVSGTPTRLIYAEQQRCIVCASLRTTVRTFPPSITRSKPEERRQIYPAIEFIPSDKSASVFEVDLQPGERVFALLEWSFTNEGKTYSFILVGGSYRKSSGTEKGRVTFLQPVNRNWDIVNVSEGKATSFDAPVYALALYDQLTFVACYGEYVVLQRYSVKDKKWEPLCEPFKLGSPGTSITISKESIYISTMKDSFIALTLEPVAAADDDECSFELIPISMGPRADTALSHAVIDFPPPATNGATTNGTHTSFSSSKVVLMSTRNARLIGFSSPPTPSADRLNNSADVLFEARLPRSLTRIRHCSIRPRWKRPPPHGVLLPDILGSTTDGTLVGAAIITSQLWRRLSWLQRLCEWSPQISPHTHETPPYTPCDDENDAAATERPMPIGLEGRKDDEVLLIPPHQTKVENDLAIDGDTLGRLLELDDPVETLRTFIRELSVERAPIGTFLRTHLQQELDAVDGAVEEVKQVLDLWF